MHEIIDNRVKKNEPLINNLSVQNEAKESFIVPIEKSETKVSEILGMKNGYGFIKPS